eukprot:SAG11_NODE_5978_length_1420_cov_1.887207_2_plen_90_part_00
MLSLPSTGGEGDEALYAGDVPDAAAKSWVAQCDEFSGKTYWWNVLTDERVWQPPPGFSAPSEAAADTKVAAVPDALSGLSAYGGGSDSD